jgi:U3 small nucleolar RNA-associated protein 12
LTCILKIGLVWFGLPCLALPLSGHKDEVTEVKFIADAKYLVSSSKDTLVKVWDLTTQYCIQTIVGHRSEVWSFDIDPSEKRLVSGASDNLIRVWSIALPGAGDIADKDKSKAGAEPDELTDSVASSSTRVEVLSFLGSFPRQAKGTARAIRVRFSKSGRVLGYQPAGRTVELYKLCTEKELHKKLLRKQKRAREKQRKQLKIKDKKGEDPMEEEDETANDPATVTVTLADEYELLSVLQTAAKNKIRTFDFSPTVRFATLVFCATPHVTHLFFSIFTRHSG